MDLIPLEDRPVHVAPTREKKQRPWEGVCKKKPWDYRVTAVIPELDSPEELALVVELLRLQTERPYIVVIDTGSLPKNFAKIEAMRAQDLEVHAIRLNGCLHPSEFVTAAMDLAFSICRTEFIYCTHSDVFPRRRDLVEWLLDQCSADCPAVGYELTPRSCPPPIVCDWQGMLGHTCTMLHMPTMDKLGAGWSMRRLGVLRGYTHRGVIPGSIGWPDTEVCLGHVLRTAGIEPKIVGIERNNERTLDGNIDHCRSLAGSKLYSAEHYAKAKAWADDARRAARVRAKWWRRADLAQPQQLVSA